MKNPDFWWNIRKIRNSKNYIPKIGYQTWKVQAYAEFRMQFQSQHQQIAKIPRKCSKLIWK